MSGYFVNGMPAVNGSQLSDDSGVPVDTSLPNGASPQAGKLIPGQMASQTGLTALAAGTKADATPLQYGINGVNAVAGAADSLLAPPAVGGASCVIINKVATAAQVFGQDTDTINGIATGTGVVLAASHIMHLYCDVDGAWWAAVSPFV